MHKKIMIYSFLFALLIMMACTQNEPIKIGFVAGLSGRNSQLGVSARNGIELAIDNINENGVLNGRKLELIVKDDKGDTETGKRVINELIDEGVTAIIGPVMSNMADSALESIKGKAVLMISPTISTDTIKDRDDNFIRVMPVASNEAKTMAQAVLKNGFKKTAVVYDASNREYTEPIYLIFKEFFEIQGNEITYVRAFEKDKEKKFSAIAREIVNSKPEALYMIMSGIDAAFLCQQIRKLDSKIMFYGSHWVKTGNIIEEGGRSVEGLTLVTPYEREEKTDEYKRFSNQYKKMYKTAPGFVSVYSYEATQLLLSGIKDCRDLRPESIKASIIKIGKFKGLEETFTINEFGDADRSNLLVVIRDGKFVRGNK